MRSLLCSLAALTIHRVFAATSTTGSGILPPPPPPPPPTASILSDDKSYVTDKEKNVDVTLPFAEVIPKQAESSEPAPIESPDGPSYDDASIREERSSPEHAGGLSGSQISQTENTWGSNAHPGTIDTDAQKTQQTQSYDSHQDWGYQQPQSHYQNPPYQGEYNQPYNYRQWGSQPQQNYQQTFPQQRQSYIHPSQSQQLIRYNRPQTNAKQSASRFFNLAVRKLQTGIDTVSESLDTNKVVSSVSSLTSRLGELGDAVSSSVGLSGRGAGRSRPVQGAIGQRYPQQRVNPRPNVRKQQEYAPPMADLYSLESSSSQTKNDQTDGSSAEVHGGMQWTADREDGAHPIDTTNIYQEHNDASDTDDEAEDNPDAGEAPDLFSRPSQLAPKPNGSGETMPSELRRPQSIRPRPRMQNPDMRRSSQSEPSGESMTSSATKTYCQYSDYDDYESASIGFKVKSIIGSVPIPSIPKLFQRSSGEYDDGAWSDDESKEKSRATSSFSSASTLAGRRASSRSSATVVPPPVMSLLGKRSNLLSASGAKRCIAVGRTQAILSSVQLALVVFAMHEILPIVYNAISSDGADLRTAVLSTVIAASDGWTLHAIFAAFLVSASNSAWIRPALKRLSKEVATESETEAAYTQLYLRLISSIPMKKSFPTGVVRKAAQAEAFNAAATARLHFFVALAIGYILLSTVAVLKPAGAAVVSATLHVVKLDAWQERPIVWNTIFERTKAVGLGLVASLRDLLSTELEEVQQQPLRVVVVLSLLTALAIVSYLPSLEKNRKPGAARLGGDEDEDDDVITSLWSNIGSSSATRLSLLSTPRGVEGALDQFSKLRPDPAAAVGVLQSRVNTKLARKNRRRQTSPSVMTSVRPLLQQLVYLASSTCLLLVPLGLYSYAWMKTQPDDGDRIQSLKSIPLDGWASLTEMVVLLVMTTIQVGSATNYAIGAANAKLGGSLTQFFQTLASIIGEIQKLASTSASNSDFQAMLTASPTQGLDVKDFWAAHSTRKAWAIKGANVKSRNGEVVLVIGAGGSGKSRLLTSISEHIFSPPKSARTTTYARGTISLAGVDLTKWDRAQLQRRVGVWLHDVRTVSDYASLVTGCTLEEILEPVSDSQMNSKERNAVSLAMKITGLVSKLSKQLPSRLSTVVSAYEDELKPSPLRPPSYPLSPSDWSLVLLTKVLAQLIAGNDSQQSSPNSIAKCLIGSILLLDDATSQMSEVDEARFTTALRSTGAAVILTSNRWATGRFADRIVVMDNGAVVESGTHAELINMGPERSLYAHQWNAMSLI
ncbi:hypothetical protein ACHAWO_006710 [Cyclotella atomus]|uniref:ABC transporter domain-containing protein n=1 Tax=Cyclotella atomus TaxID=382360 RepID=A0ABD3PF42_9STRA